MVRYIISVLIIHTLSELAEILAEFNWGKQKLVIENYIESNKFFSLLPSMLSFITYYSIFFADIHSCFVVDYILFLHLHPNSVLFYYSHHYLF